MTKILESVAVCIKPIFDLLKTVSGFMFAFANWIALLLLLCGTKMTSKNYLEHENHVEIELSLVVKDLYEI